MRTLVMLVALAAAGICAQGQNLIVNGDAENGMENWNDNQVAVCAEKPHDGKNCFKSVAGNIQTKELIPVDPSKAYKLSGWFRSGDNKKIKLLVGLVPHNESKKWLQSQFVNPVAGTETELVQNCKETDTVIKVKEAGKWKKEPTNSLIAFNVDATGGYKDIPNTELSTGNVIKVEQKGGSWELTLEKPCGKPYPAGTKVRQHQRSATYIYPLTVNDFNSTEWQEVSAVVKDVAQTGCYPGTKFWNSTKYVKIVILPINGGIIYFDDLKLEELKAEVKNTPEGEK